LVPRQLDHGEGIRGVAWDYSDKLLNLHGRICLQYSCCWGPLAVSVVYVFDPFIDRFVTVSEWSSPRDIHLETTR